MKDEPRAEVALQHIIRWALGRVRHHLRRYGYRLKQSAGGPTGMYVSVDEARRVLDGSDGFDLAAALGVPADEADVPCPTASPLPPIADLSRRLGLSRLEVRILLAAAATHLSADVERLYTFALADFTRKVPPAGFLAELVTDDASAAVVAHTCFRADATLVRQGLIRLLDEAPLGADAPPGQRGVVVPAAVIGFLRGESPAISTALADGLEHGCDPRLDLAKPEPGRVELLQGLLASERARLVLVGVRGAGRRRALLAALGPARRLLTVDLDRLPAAPDALAPLLTEATRVAGLYDLHLLLRADAALAEPDDPRTAVIDRVLRRYPGPVALTGRSDLACLGLRPVHFPLPDARRQRDLWRRTLAAVDVHDAEMPDRLVQRFNASPGAIDAAVREASRRSAGEPPGLSHVVAALRRRIRHALDAIAEPMTTTLTWEDVVLPDEVVETLHEIGSQARNRLRVFDEWGFRRKMAYGRGLACLFAGPPGTGKTMMAGILARDLGCELYRVDLSRLVSKWVGETEKNLARVFDEAEQAQVILLFDEADSLFSKRTEVKGANDRFANMEVNYLLQRMESFDGMTILTTNLEHGLDEAFKRRLRFRVHFSLPDATERARLWASMIPPQMPAADDIDFRRLGKRHVLSGGAIKSAVLRAAFYAAEGDGILTTALLHRAARTEARELGRL